MAGGAVAVNDPLMAGGMPFTGERRWGCFPRGPQRVSAHAHVHTCTRTREEERTSVGKPS